jgi:hypothetical protein
MNTHTMPRPDLFRLCFARLAPLLLGLAGVLLPLVQAADVPKAPAPTTAPVPVPVPPPPAPKAVAIAFVAALDKGDAATAKSLLPADETHAAWVDASIALSTGLKKLDAAAAAKFNEAGKVVSQNQLHLTDSFKSLDQAQEKIEGDTATLTIPGQTQPLRLNRVGGKWLLLVGPTGPTAQRQLSLYPRLTRAATLTGEEIAAGAYATPEAAARVFAARLLEARLAN